VTAIVQRLVRAGLQRVGKDYTPAPDLPVGLIIHVFRVRVGLAARGLVRFRCFAFVGRGVSVRGKRRIMLGRASTLETGVVIDGYAREGVVVGPRTRIGAHTIISCTSHLSLHGKGFRIGAESGIAEFGYIGAAGGVTIGDHVIMGQYVSFHSQEHQFGDVTIPIRLQPSTQRGIVVDDDCWVGARVTFLDGTHVREGSVVAAGAVVKGDFPPHSVLGGVPARILKSRDPALA
jgi:acetyltransferase-like isoleucine patch superfamily enzyme